MSSDEEINQVYQQEIHDKTRQVANRQGVYPFLEDFDYSIFDIYDLSDEDRELLRQILEEDNAI